MDNLSDLSPTQFRFPKFYRMPFYGRGIKAFGSVDITSTGFGEQSHAVIKGAICFTNRHGSDAIDAQVHHPTEVIAHKSHCPPFCSPFVKHRVKGASKKLCCQIPFFWWCWLEPHGQYNCMEHIVCKGFKEFLTVLRGVAWSGCNCLSDQHGVQLRRPSITQLVKTLLPVSKHTMPLP